MFTFGIPPGTIGVVSSRKMRSIRSNRSIGGSTLEKPNLLMGEVEILLFVQKDSGCHHGGYRSTRVLEHASLFCRFWGIIFLDAGNRAPIYLLPLTESEKNYTITSWISPITLLSASRTRATNLPRPTSTVSCSIRAPEATSDFKLFLISLTCQ